MLNPLEIVGLAWVVFVLVALFHSTPLFTKTIFKETENPGFIRRILLCPKCMGFELSVILGTCWILLSGLSILESIFAWIILWPSAGGLAWVFHILLFDWFVERRFDFSELETEKYLEPEPLVDDKHTREPGGSSPPEDPASVGSN